MEHEEFKHLINAPGRDRPAILRFHGAVTAESAERFRQELQYAQFCEPSKIVVMVNSEGGSVVAGMSIFSAIQSSPIEVHCVVEGLAGSMGSVIWAAGTKLYMHDYSLLMIHNPWHKNAEDADVDTKNMLGAFKKQLETVYTKRLGLTKAKVQKIMNGAEGADGTFLTAEDAVKYGLLPANHVIQTSEQVRAELNEKLKGVQGEVAIADIMASMTSEAHGNKLIENTLAILEKNKQSNLIQEVMNEKELAFDAVCAQLGLAADATASVAPRLAELKTAETDLKSVKVELTTVQTECAKIKAELDELNILFKGKEAEVKNTADELTEVKAKLKTYEDAEAAAKKAHIEEVVNAAVEAGKILQEDADTWLVLAETNLPLVEKTLAGIAPREKVTEAIANDPANVEAAVKASEDLDKVLGEKLKAVLGEFNLQTF